MQRPYKIGIISFAAFILAALLFWLIRGKSVSDKAAARGGRAEAPLAVSVEGVIARRTTLANEVLSAGTLLANEEAEIKPEITGRITSIAFNEGQRVQERQLLVKFFDGDLKAQLSRARAQFSVLEKTLEREKALLALQGTSQQELDVLEGQCATARADIEIVQANIAKTEIRAPFSGKVGLRTVSVGAVVSPTQVITTIQQTSSLKMEFSLPEKYSADILVGSEVKFSVEGVRDTLTAKVYAIDAKIDPATRTLRVRARFDNAGGKIMPGAFARVVVPLQSKSVIMVPTEAVVPQARGKSVIVAENGKAVMRFVETGLRTADQVEIVSGVAEGDTIVTKGVMFVKPQMQLNFTNVML
jgi:membrane fusion protein (multidrug efflux system)